MARVVITWKIRLLDRNANGHESNTQMRPRRDRLRPLAMPIAVMFLPLYPSRKLRM
jgi:hypothetical protein